MTPCRWSIRKQRNKDKCSYPHSFQSSQGVGNTTGSQQITNTTSKQISKMYVIFIMQYWGEMKQGRAQTAGEEGPANGEFEILNTVITRRFYEKTAFE